MKFVAAVLNSKLISYYHRRVFLDVALQRFQKILINIDSRALNPKTKLDEFWKLEAIDLFAHLRKNVRRLEEQKVRLSKEVEDKIRSRFLSAKEALLPLEGQIALTDQLIIGWSIVYTA